MVALMIEEQTFNGVARRLGLARESLRSYLKIRPELKDAMLVYQKPKLTAEQYLQNNRKAKKTYAARKRLEDPEGTRKARRDFMNSYGPEYRRKWNNYNRERRKTGHPPEKEDRDIATAYMKLIINDPCFYCGAEAEHIDHVIPIAKGGKTVWHNLVPACASCNFSKGAKDLDEFLAQTKIGGD